MVGNKLADAVQINWVWMLIAQIRSAGLGTGIIRALGRVIAWYCLTFPGVMVGSTADHYERATDETNDSPYSNPYDAASRSRDFKNERCKHSQTSVA